MTRHYDRHDCHRRVENGGRMSPSQRAKLERLQIHVDEWHRVPTRSRVVPRGGRRRTFPGRLKATATVVFGSLLFLAMAGLAFLLVSRPVSPSPYLDAIGEPQLPKPAPTPNQVGDLREEAARVAHEKRIPTGLFAAIIQIESAWRVDAVGRAGEIGLTQLRPSTAVALGVDPYDPLQNLEGGARYLRSHYDRLGDWTRAIARYNGAGPRARAYAERVLRAWEAAPAGVEP